MTTTRAGTDRRLRAIYDVLPEIVLVVDRAGTIVEAHMGTSFEGRVVANDLVGASIRDVLPRDIAPITMEHLDETFIHGTALREYRSAFAGVQRYVETRGIRFDDELALVVVRDITERKRSDDDLRSSREHLRAIYDAFPDMISISNREGVIKEVKLGRREAPTVDLRTIVGQSFSDLFEPEEAARQYESQARALAGEVITFQYPFTFEGVTFWGESSGARLDDDHVLWVTHDITARVHAEQELRESEDRYRSIVETAAEGIIALDADFRFTFVNERAEDLLRYEHGELIGQHLTDLLAPDRQYLAADKNARRRAGMSERFETKLLRGDGTEVWVLISARPRYDADGEFIGSFTMLADISELKEAQARHRRLLRRVDVAEDEERRRLAEGLHDGPMQELAAMALRLGTLRLGLDDEETASRIREIEDVTRATLGELRALMFALQPPEIGDGGLVPALRSCAAVLFADTDTSVMVDGWLPREPTESIAATAYRIVSEALVNVRLHAHATEVGVTVEERNDAVLLTIADDGIGIDPAILRAGAPGHLGLRTMHERAEAAGGWCTVDRVPTGGTVVVARLPLADDAGD